MGETPLWKHAGGVAGMGVARLPGESGPRGLAYPYLRRFSRTRTEI